MGIYKYTHQDRIKNILVDNLIRFTQPKYFNDPFEIKPVIKGLTDEESFLKDFDDKRIHDEIMKLYAEEPNSLDLIHQNEYLKNASMIIENSRNHIKETIFNPENIQRMNEEHFKIFNETVGILSLTTKYDNLLMWAHYADSHKGFVVEFDSENEFFKYDEDVDNLMGKLQKVVYSVDRPAEYFSKFDIAKAFLTKSKEWEYEDEYRMFHSLKQSNTQKQIGDEEIHLFKFPKAMIKTIYCGVNMTEENKLDIVETIKNDKELEHVRVYESKISNDVYKLEQNLLL